MAPTPGKKCGAQFVTGGRTLTCNRTDLHLTHRDAKSGDRFVRVPGGAVIVPNTKP